MPEPETCTVQIHIFSRDSMFLGYVDVTVRGEYGEDAERRALDALTRRVQRLSAKPMSFLNVRVDLPRPSRGGDLDDLDMDLEEYEEFDGYRSLEDGYPRASIGAVRPEVIGYLHVVRSVEDEFPEDEGEEFDAGGQDALEIPEEDEDEGDNVSRR